MKKPIAFFKDEEGTTAVEYGIMVAAIAAVIVTTVIWVGNQTYSGFTTVNMALTPLSGNHCQETVNNPFALSAHRPAADSTCQRQAQ